MANRRDTYEHSAVIYDRFYRLQGKDYEAESAQVTEQIRARNPQAATLLDVGCGAGDHLVYLQADFSVAGSDVSPAMLAIARERLPGVQLTENDMRDLDVDGSYDAIICMFSAIGYMRSTDELDAAIAAMARHLAPGGVLVVDGWVRPHNWNPSMPVSHEIVEDEHGMIARFVKRWRDGDTTILEMHYLGSAGDDVLSFMERHELTLFSEEQYRAAFTRAGLRVEVVPGPTPNRDRYIGTFER